MKNYKSKLGLELIIPISLIFGYALFELITEKSWFGVNENIEIKTIRKITETYNPLSSPAASIDRIEIFYNKFDSVLISPKKKKEFIEDILKINPNIEVIYRKK